MASRYASLKNLLKGNLNDDLKPTFFNASSLSAGSLNAQMTAMSWSDLSSSIRHPFMSALKQAVSRPYGSPPSDVVGNVTYVIYEGSGVA